MLWFRRDLRLGDLPALHEAAERGPVLPLFVLDPALWGPSGDARRAYLLTSLRALDADLGGTLAVVAGDPVEVVPRLAAQVGAASVHASADTGVYGRRRDEAVAAALEAAGRALVRTGTPYAVGPGTLRTGAGEPFKVFTPFARAWRAHGWPAPAGPPPRARWLRGAAPGVDGEDWPAAPDLGDLRLPPPGEQFALLRWREFRDTVLAGYDTSRDRPDLDGTSQLSAALKWGEVHPRTLLADLASSGSPGAEAFRTELAWREFYADVLWHRPESAREYLRPEMQRLAYSEPGDAFEAWAAGRTGFPFVDAGMRQMRAEGWMHNRVRMVVASFLVKDLHVEWTYGAREFMHRLRDGDLASNAHGWQWVAGSGTDAAPFFRVFNPVTQGQRYDPDGDYVRRFVPELRHLPGASVHEPWKAADGYAHGYPERVVDHAAERAVALEGYRRVKG
ncbi:deoxyribodipyrimidine photo-lyase [Kineococcus sp. NUM-3379]